MSVECKKLSWPHGSSLSGAETGAGAEGCAAWLKLTKISRIAYNRTSILEMNGGGLNCIESVVGNRYYKTSIHPVARVIDKSGATPHARIYVLAHAR